MIARAKATVLLLVALGACGRKPVSVQDTSRPAVTPDAAVDAAVASAPAPQPPVPTGPPSWRWENPRIPADDLHAIWGSSASDVYAVGARGTILHTRDGGRIWTREQSGTTAGLTAIWGSGADDVYVVGGDGTILHSTDGGTTWTPQNSAKRQDLRAIWGSGKRDVFILEAEGELLHSADSGRTWKPRKPGGKRHQTFSDLWGSGNEVYVVGYDEVNELCKPGKRQVDHECLTFTPVGVVMYSANAGKTWTHESTFSRVPHAIWGTSRHRYIAFWDDVDRVESIKHFDDTGTLGVVHTAPLADRAHSIWGSGTTDVFAVGAGGTILHSSDSRTWKPQASGVSHALNAVWGSGKSNVFVVGELGTILHSTNSGATWSLPAATTARDLQAVWGAGGDVLAVGKDGVIVRRSSSGNWTTETSGTTEPLAAIWGSGKDDVFVVGNAGVILHGTGAGRPWKRQTSSVPTSLAAVWGSGKDDVFIVGSHGAILRTTNSGRTWIRQTSGTKEDLTAIWGSGKTDIYVVSWQGAILHSSDSGQTWVRRPDAVKPARGNVTFAALWGSKDDRFVVGHRGIVRSTDAGKTWQVDANADAIIDRGGAPIAVWGRASNDVYVLANRYRDVVAGSILHSTDGGKHWVQIQRPGFSGKHWGRRLSGIWGNGHELFVVGRAGTILRYGP